MMTEEKIYIPKKKGILYGLILILPQEKRFKRDVPGWSYLDTSLTVKRCLQ
ncbi:MazF family toxin-antitoxin system, toxin component [Enterococcus sp. DIV0756]